MSYSHFVNHYDGNYVTNSDILLIIFCRRRREPAAAIS